MKISQAQYLFIKNHVDEKSIDIEKLVMYIECHRIIKNDVFRKCAIRSKKRSLGDEPYCGLLDYPYAFTPINRDVFIRRIPFLFYHPTANQKDELGPGLWSVLSKFHRVPNPKELENLYADLEFMYYNLHLDLNSIFSYISDQIFRKRKRYEVKAEAGKFPLFSGIEYENVFEYKGELTYGELFDMWRHYLRLCFQRGKTDFFPKRLITAYNFAREDEGLNPIIYYPLLQSGIEYFYRDKDEYVCKGNFPCDLSGKPILRWTSIRVHNEKSITFSGNKSEAGILKIKIQPSTTIHLLGRPNIYDENAIFDNEWHQIYAGPLNMEFNYLALREIRIACGFTQKEVAEAIGANIRTYQKWEGNESIPDGHYLLRLMNWLEITDVQDLICYQKEDIY